MDATLLFDSTALPAAERYAATQEVLVRSSHPTTLDPIDAADATALQFQAWAMAPDAMMFAASGAALHMWRRETRHWYDDEPLFALTTQLSGHARMAQNDADAALLPGSLRLVDLGAAYDYASPEAGNNVSYQLTMDAVGLQRAEIAAAAPRLSVSPLCAIVRESLTDLAAHAQAGGQLYQELHQSMVDLTRALIVSVLTEDSPRSLPDSDVMLWAALCSYIRRHLHERSLDEASAAASLGVGQERLRRVAEAHGAELSDYIRTRRVTAAKTDLARCSGRILPPRAVLASTAARWGFASVDNLLEAMTAGPADPFY